MRVVLETSDLLEILGTHLGRELLPEQVFVRTEPQLEIEIVNAVNVADVRSKTKSAPEGNDDLSVLAPVRTPVRGQVVIEEDSGMSMRDLLTYSREIEQGLEIYGRR